MTKTLYLFFVRPFLVTVVVIMAVLLVWHVRLGEHSPGLVLLAKSAMTYWIPLLTLIFFVVPSILGIRRLIQMNAKARSRGLTFSDYVKELNEQRSERKG